MTFLVSFLASPTLVVRRTIQLSPMEQFEKVVLIKGTRLSNCVAAFPQPAFGFKINATRLFDRSVGTVVSIVLLIQFHQTLLGSSDS